MGHTLWSMSSSSSSLSRPISSSRPLILGSSWLVSSRTLRFYKQSLVTTPLSYSPGKYHSTQAFIIFLIYAVNKQAIPIRYTFQDKLLYDAYMYWYNLLEFVAKCSHMFVLLWVVHRWIHLCVWHYILAWENRYIKWHEYLYFISKTIPHKSNLLN